MCGKENEMNIITRREIEARIAGPLIKAFIEEFGRERTVEVVKGVIESLALESGVELAKKMGGNTTFDFAEGLKAWSDSGALEMDVLELNDEEYIFYVTRCLYKDLYDELGLADLGVVLSCNRDYGLIEGFNSELELSRKKTIMEGCDYCDFLIKKKEK